MRALPDDVAPNGVFYFGAVFYKYFAPNGACPQGRRTVEVQLFLPVALRSLLQRVGHKLLADAPPQFTGLG